MSNSVSRAAFQVGTLQKPCRLSGSDSDKRGYSPGGWGGRKQLSGLQGQREQSLPGWTGAVLFDPAAKEAER